MYRNSGDNHPHNSKYFGDISYLKVMFIITGTKLSGFHFTGIFRVLFLSIFTIISIATIYNIVINW